VTCVGNAGNPGAFKGGPVTAQGIRGVLGRESPMVVAGLTMHLRGGSTTEPSRRERRVMEARASVAFMWRGSPNKNLKGKRWKEGRHETKRVENRRGKTTEKDWHRPRLAEGRDAKQNQE